MTRLSAKNDKERKLAQIGAAIRARRKELGISQENLALSAEIERSNMGKIERGENNLSMLNFIRIANALDCKAADILFAAEM